jgi:hypothetical protein
MRRQTVREKWPCHNRRLHRFELLSLHNKQPAPRPFARRFLQDTNSSSLMQKQYLGHCLLADEAEAALKDGLCVGAEGGAERLGDGGEALEEGEDVLVAVLQLLPLGHQGGHDDVQQVGLRQVAPHHVRQRPDRIVQDAQVLSLHIRAVGKRCGVCRHRHSTGRDRRADQIDDRYVNMSVKQA